jgi:probable HAF family extracellular repeat protein
MLIWDNGSVRTVDMAGEDADLYDVNSSGDAVGYSYVTPEQTAAFAYVDGTMTRLAGVNAMATQIGENGAIVGSIGTGGNAWTTVVWRSPSAQPEPLPQPTGLSNASAVAIDTDGTIIGSARGGRGQDVPVLWRPDGTVLTLAWPRAAHPDGSSPGSIGFIGGVHDGWVAVELRDFLIDGRDHAQDDWYTWNIHTGQTRELDVAPELVNAQGWVVAHALDAWLVLDSERGRVTLSTLPGVADAPLTSAQVTSLSDDGRTIGGSFARLTASFGDDDNIPVVWRCS